MQYFLKEPDIGKQLNVLPMAYIQSESRVWENVKFNRCTLERTWRDDQNVAGKTKVSSKDFEDQLHFQISNFK